MDFSKDDVYGSKVLQVFYNLLPSKILFLFYCIAYLAILYNVFYNLG